MRPWLIVPAFLTVLALVFLIALDAMLIGRAFAHDSWISRGALRNGAGEWCCGEGDCGILDRDAVKPTPQGFRIDGFATIGEGPGAIREEIHELVPFSEAQPSPDGAYWRCRRLDGSRRCFFAPPPAT